MKPGSLLQGLEFPGPEILVFLYFPAIIAQIYLNHLAGFLCNKSQSWFTQPVVPLVSNFDATALSELLKGVVLCLEKQNWSMQSMGDTPRGQFQFLRFNFSISSHNLYKKKTKFVYSMRIAINVDLSKISHLSANICFWFLPKCLF